MKLTEMGFKKEKSSFYVTFEKVVKFYGNYAEIMIAYNIDKGSVTYHLRVNDQEIINRVISKEMIDALYEELEEL